MNALYYNFIFCAITQISNTLRIGFDIDCFIETIYSQNYSRVETNQSFDYQVALQSNNFESMATWAIYNYNQPSLTVTIDDVLNSDNPLSINDKYFRYSRINYRSPCILIMIFVNVLASLEIISGVNVSGFGNSEWALILVNVPVTQVYSESVVMETFETLFSEDTEEKFHASIFIYLISENETTFYCYFCAANKISSLNHLIGLTKLQNLSRTISAKGLYVFPRGLNWNFRSGCFGTPDELSNHNNFVENLKYCWPPELVLLSPIFKFLNFSFPNSFEDLDDSVFVKGGWFLNAVFGETETIQIRNDVAFTRSYLSYAIIYRKFLTVYLNSKRYFCV